MDGGHFYKNMERKYWEHAEILNARRTAYLTVLKTWTTMRKTQMANGLMNDCCYEMWIVMMGRDGIGKRYEEIVCFVTESPLGNLCESSLRGPGSHPLQ